LIHVGILSYARARYLWWAVATVVAAWMLYATQRGLQPPNGGTWQGYILGTAGALLIVWLALLGVRKRRYRSTLGTVQGWTSAHVYLGSALLIVATLHSAAQLGMNVHTLAYVLMCAVIFSGFYGVFTYVNYPHLINSNRAGLSRAELFAELYELDRRGRELASRAPHAVSVAARSSIERTAIGGGLIAQLFGKDRSQIIRDSDESGGGRLSSNRDQEAVIEFIAEHIPKTNKIAEAELLQELLAVFCRRQAVLRRIARDIRMQGWLRVWLFVHIPMSIALLVALAIHILTTFIYW
jgi:hypothetical protein